MKISEMQPNTFGRMDNLIIMKLPNGDVDLAMPGQPLKSGKSPIDITVQPATKEDMLDAVNRSDNGTDWYALLLKEVMVKRLNELP